MYLFTLYESYTSVDILIFKCIQKICEHYGIFVIIIIIIIQECIVYALYGPEANSVAISE